MGLAQDQTTYDVACPVCGRDKSFAVTKTQDALLFCCHRNKCGIKGVVPIRDKGILPSNNKVKVYVPWNKPTRKLNGREKYFLWYKYKLTYEDIYINQISWSIKDDRMVFPIFSHSGDRIGEALRKYDELAKVPGVKSITHLDPEKPKLHFPLGAKPSSRFILVEDQVSSIRCSPYGTAVALLGTSLNDSQVVNLTSYGARDLIIFLDDDAIDKAVKYKREYQSSFNSVKVVHNKKDPKDCTEGELFRIFTVL